MLGAHRALEGRRDRVQQDGAVPRLEPAPRSPCTAGDPGLHLHAPPPRQQPLPQPVAGVGIQRSEEETVGAQNPPATAAGGVCRSVALSQCALVDEDVELKVESVVGGERSRSTDVPSPRPTDKHARLADKALPRSDMVAQHRAPVALPSPRPRLRPRLRSTAAAVTARSAAWLARRICPRRCTTSTLSSSTSGA
jgi:hypothetical protein